MKSPKKTHLLGYSFSYLTTGALLIEAFEKTLTQKTMAT